MRRFIPVIMLVAGLYLVVLLLLPVETETAAPGPIRFPPPAAAAQIDSLYQDQVKPIIDAKCIDCHGRCIRFPWYHRAPFVRQLIDDDRQRALNMIDFTDGFPFRGMRPPRLAIGSISGVARQGLMPPLQYQLVHRHSALTPEECEKVYTWVSQCQPLLNPPVNNPQAP